MKRKCEKCGEHEEIKAGTSPIWCNDCYDDYVWEKFRQKLAKKHTSIHNDLISQN